MTHQSRAYSSWSIGIYIGESPFQLRPAPEINNPVLSSWDVTDVAASLVADPFMIKADHTWHMFFEVMDTSTEHGQIGLAMSTTGLDWKYQQIVLEEPYHLSYPYVFAWEGQYYMVPETLQAHSIRLYKAVNFPTQWSLVGSLVEGRHADPSLFYFNDQWWMFTCSTPSQHDTLRLYMASDLLGPWREHPASPIVVGDNRSARPGGRVLILGDRVIRYAQDCYPRYGTQVRAFEISELTQTTYHEREREETPVLTVGNDAWNRGGMHHIDPHLMTEAQWVACVDGQSVGQRPASAIIRHVYAQP
jgi:hypothetical protein